MAKPRNKSRSSIDAELALTADVLAKAEAIAKAIGRNTAVRVLAYAAWRVRGWTSDRDRYVSSITES